MSETWFISDTHFGHANILEYEKEARPFDTLEEMHEVMIERWNHMVNPKDTVYHLGDFAFGLRNIHIAAQLCGKKKLILGNHDTYASAEYLRYFDKLYGVIFWERCVLSHMPVHPNGLGSRWLLNVHGHLHSKKVTDAVDPEGEVYPDWRIENKNYFNVSCEQNNLTPIHRDEIMKRLKEIE